MRSPLAPINLSCMNWYLSHRFGFVCVVFWFWCVVFFLCCACFWCLVFVCFLFRFCVGDFATERRTMYRSFTSSFHAASHMKTAC